MQTELACWQGRADRPSPWPLAPENRTLERDNRVLRIGRRVARVSAASGRPPVSPVPVDITSCPAAGGPFVATGKPRRQPNRRRPETKADATGARLPNPCTQHDLWRRLPPDRGAGDRLAKKIPHLRANFLADNASCTSTASAHRPGCRSTGGDRNPLWRDAPGRTARYNCLTSLAVCRGRIRSFFNRARRREPAMRSNRHQTNRHVRGHRQERRFAGCVLRTMDYSSSLLRAVLGVLRLEVDSDRLGKRMPARKSPAQPAQPAKATFGRPSSVATLAASILASVATGRMVGPRRWMPAVCLSAVRS